MPASPLPLFDYSLEDLYSYISPSTFVDILTCLLLEHQVMLLSKGWYIVWNLIFNLSTIESNYYKNFL